MHEATLLADHLKAALLFAAKDDIRFYLNGVLLTDRRMVATCGSMLITLDEPALVGWPDVIVPRDMIEIALRFNSKALQSFPLTFDGSMLQLGLQKLPAKPVDGRFPDWRRVLPKSIEAPSSWWVDPNLARRIPQATRLLTGPAEIITYVAAPFRGAKCDQGSLAFAIGDRAFGVIAGMRKMVDVEAVVKYRLAEA